MTLWKLLVSGLFNLTIVLHFIFTSQYKHNMYTLSINIKFIYALCENGQKISSKDKCVPVSKVLTNNFIFTDIAYVLVQNIRYVYICLFI